MIDTKQTPGPWAWALIGEKTNGYVVGIAYDENGKQLSGCIDDNLLIDEVIINGDIVGDYEATTCNYANARLIAAAPELLEALKFTQEAIAHWRDEESIIHPKHGDLTLEEVKYCVIDPALAKATGIESGAMTNPKPESVE